MRRWARRIAVALASIVASWAMGSAWFAMHALPLESEATPASGPTGAFHVHTDRSDGLGTPEEVYAAAAQAGLDFVVVTDHNLDPPLPTRVGSVLVVPGVELSTARGHLLAVGAARTPDGSLRERDPIAAGRFAGGLLFAAHPLNRRRPWDGPWEGLDGVEIVSGDSLWRDGAADWLGTLLPALVALPLAPRHAALVFYRRPDAVLSRWGEEVGRGNRLVGICAHDAHGHVGYRVPFEVMKIHLELDVPLVDDPVAAADQVVEAMRQGMFYCSLDGLLDPGGFTFRVSRAGVSATAPQSMPEDARSIVRLYRGSEQVAATKGDDEMGVAVLPAPGAYRAEVDLTVPWPGGERTFLWIFTPYRFVE